MSQNKSSQSQKSTTETPPPAGNGFALGGFDPMEMWSKMTAENLARVQALYDELASWEARAYERAKQTADQMADLASDSLAYATKLAAEWRNLTLEATRKSAELLRSNA